jgi:hypothetical protein
MDACQEVSGGFVIARCDSAELLEFGEEVLDQVARFVDVPVVVPLDFPICLGRDHGGLMLVGQHGDNPFIGIICLIGDQQISLHVGEQVIGPDQIMGLAAAQREGDRIAQRINQSMDFGAQSAAGSSDGLVFPRFFWAPALC